MAKGRSPNYPSVTLREAIDRIRQVYTAEHTHVTDKLVVAKDLGYNGLNGKSLTLLGALKRYGLLESVGGDGLKVTDDAVTILELPQNDPERAKAVEKAAFTPGLFDELRETFGDSLPSDDNLRHYLIKKAFLPRAASDVILVYRDNLDLVSEQKAGYNVPVESTPKFTQTTSKQNYPEVPLDRLTRVVSGSKPLGYEDDVLSFNLSRTGKAQVRFDGQVTQEALKKLIALLELSLDTYPTQAELVQPKQAMWRNKDHDQPVTVTGELGEKDGKKFYAIAESSTGISEDELDFEVNN